MATAGDVVKRALRLINVVGTGYAPSAEEMQDGLTALRRMLAAWELQGVRLGDLVGATLTTTTVIPLPESHLDAIETNLGVRMLPEYNKQPHPGLVRDADDGFRALQAAYVQVPVARIDPALRSTYWPWGRRYV